jgi:S-adenosylmethionine decarboxylase
MIMLAPKLYRQRCTIELITNNNLYDTSIVEEMLENFLHDLCGTLGLEIIVGPIIRTVEDGTSAYVMFTESGCHIHSWFEHKFISVDLYSCKPFMVSDILDVIEFWFNPEEVEII